jgi:hypothetical protein
MPYYEVTFNHTTRIEADSEEDAKILVAESIRDNADTDECDATEISEEEYID